jgi:IS4 transposase|tara:strand:- start:471 stop:689 length:219 start_codon:yes stop_codon:yes gene_type:complete
MTRQEENWEMAMLLQIPWHEAQKIDSQEDRDFLMVKAKQMREHMEQQMKAQAQQSPIIGGAPAGGLPDYLKV